MNKTLAQSLVRGGIGLLFVGLFAYDSSGSGLTQLFRTSGVDKSTWVLGGGLVATFTGLFGRSRRFTSVRALFQRKPSRHAVSSRWKAPAIVEED